MRSDSAARDKTSVPFRRAAAIIFAFSSPDAVRSTRRPPWGNEPILHTRLLTFLSGESPPSDPFNVRPRRRPCACPVAGGTCAAALRPGAFCLWRHGAAMVTYGCENAAEGEHVHARCDYSRFGTGGTHCRPVHRTGRPQPPRRRRLPARRPAHADD